MEQLSSSTQLRGVVRLISTELVELPNEALGIIRDRDDAGRLIASVIGMKDREHFVALHLSANLTVLGFETVSIGSQSTALVHPRETFKGAILKNAASIIVGHNHPSGSLKPSPEDEAIYDLLLKAGEFMGIPVADSFIVAGDRWYSMERGR